MLQISKLKQVNFLKYRFFLTVLILIFSLQNTSKANDINQFEIEGMSIGDSLLDYVNKRTINTSRKYEYDDDKFYTIDLILNNFENYYAVQIHLKQNDQKFIIYGIGGAIKFGEPGKYFLESIKQCKEQMNIIEKDIDKIFIDADKQSAQVVGQGDYDPEAVRDEIYYTLENGHIYLQCVTWGKLTKEKDYLFDNLRLTMLSMEFYNWIENEAYN